MKLGVMANCFGDKSWEEACKAASEAGLKAIEPGCGGFVGKAHCDPASLLKDEDGMRKFRQTAEKYGLEISALSCHGNVLHPQKNFSDEHTADLEATIELASKIGVKVINVFARYP
ncbi:unnamed protein product [marine sediment metagenome]|uniref:Xylose isomerase-like TIM barrel domain-containing protein n=1 Tax=marine sediment metagenome TaxID=412755 RepID=X1CYQ5_9ZZZZ